ncbi:uncharacterized protein LOC144096206 [Amblyomma americanum]
MMKTIAYCLLLVALIGVARADPSEGTSTCQLDDDSLKTLVSCVTPKAGGELSKKLDSVRQRLECPDIECGVRKICEKNNGSLEHTSNEYFTEEEKASIRALFKNCRGQS